MSTLDTQLSPLCSLPCSVRFTIWSMRVAWLSLQGADGAHARLREIGRLLQIEDGVIALERLLALLKADSHRNLEIREFGSTYPSAAEIDLLVALGWLQEGRIACGERVLSGYARQDHLDSVVSAASFWVECLARSEIMLPHFEEVSDCTAPTSESRTPVHATMH
jgi:hypothetical protein